MKQSHIDTQPIKQSMSPGTRRIRKHAPRFIASVINDTRALPHIDSIEELHPHQVSALSGGNEAATYLVRSSRFQVIIKLNYRGIEAEVEALKAWKKRHVRVPKIFAYGVVPATKRFDRKVKYLVQQAFVDRTHRVAETADHYLVHNLGRARAVGRLLGTELSKIHGAVAPRSFGDFADSRGNTAPYRSWNGYLLGYLKAQEPYMRKIGFSDGQLKDLHRRIKEQTFIGRGRYLHGDFSARNAAIKSYKPLKIGIFDPNTLVGDPSWDIAVLFNNYEFQRRLSEHGAGHPDLLHRDCQLLIGFKQGYKRKVYKNRLRMAQLVQAALQAQHKEDKVKLGEADTIELEVRNELIADLTEKIIKEGNR